MELRELQAEYLRQQRQVTDERIAVGALIRTILSEADGLVFKNGRTEKPKRLVVIGVDHEQALCFGSVLVNTKLNPKAQYSAEYLSAQYELKQENYPEFLDYNSFVHYYYIVHFDYYYFDLYISNYFHYVYFF